jgi:enamine deaminase RidA (YjgF/YER057c/UK114 family)
VGVERFGSGAPWERSFGYSRVVRAGDFVLVAGTTAIDEDGVVRAPGDAAGQVAAVLEAIEAALGSAGARMEQVVQTRMYVTDISRADEIGRAHGERFGEIAPVTSMVQVEALVDPRMLVEIEAVAYVGEASDPGG